jgi:hypothetical protein
MKKIALLSIIWCNSLWGQWDIVGTRGFSNFDAFNLNMELSHNGVPYISFKGWQSGCTVMNFFSTWDTVGERNFSSGIVTIPNIAFDNENILYAIYCDVNRGAKATVMRYKNESWEAVGDTALTDGPATYGVITIHPLTNEPYIAYRDKIRDFTCSVMKFNGTSWEYVGTPGFSDMGNGWQGASNINLKFDSQGTPYVSFLDCSNGWKASVAKFDGSNWVYLGGPGFTVDKVGSPSLLIDHNDVVYFAFPDHSVADKISVQKFNGTSWDYVGAAGFSIGYAEYASLACDAKNNLFVAYSDGGAWGYAAVKKFNGYAWKNLGDSVVSEASSAYVNLKIDRYGTAYLAYQDGGVNYYATVQRFTGAGQSVGITENNNEGIDFSVLPNPCLGIFTLSYPKIKSPVELRINNALGETIYSELLSQEAHEKQIDLNGFTQGIYFLELNDGKRKSFKKLILQ